MGGRVMLVARRATLYSGSPDSTLNGRDRHWHLIPLAGGAGCPMGFQLTGFYGDVVVWGGNADGPATVHVVSLPSLRQCFSARTSTGTWNPELAGRILAWLRRHSCGYAPGLQTDMTLLATGVVRGHRLPIPLEQLQSTPVKIGRRNIVWISQKGRLIALDLRGHRLRVLAQVDRFTPFFLRDGLVAWQQGGDGTIHVFDLRAGQLLKVPQGWCTESAICTLAGIAPGGSVALDVAHFNAEATAVAWEDLILENLR
jgi:hypothetical protein